MRRVLLALLVLLLLPAATFAADERPAPSDMVNRLLSASLPGRDPLDLAARLHGLPPGSLAVPHPQAVPLALGREDSFWILDQRTAQLFQTRATLRLTTDHAYWFVETALNDR